MPQGMLRRNERSWAISMITDINLLLSRRGLMIKRAGGEETVYTGRERMFPDVILYGDEEQTQILQGWELKMPDTPITDGELIRNACAKAEAFGVNSFFLWNFTAGVLYVRGEEGRFLPERHWNGTSHIRTRQDVETYKADWLGQIEEVLLEINRYFRTGRCRPAGLEAAVADGVVPRIIARGKAVTAEHLRSAAVRDAVMEAHLAVWWSGVRQEYGADEPGAYAAYAKTLLLGWANRLAFAHLIKSRFDAAWAVDALGYDSTPAQAEEILGQIAAQCGFHGILQGSRYGDRIPGEAWRDLMELSLFLRDNGLGAIPQTALQQTLERSVQMSRRELAGQFTTPPALAEILCRITLRDYEADCIDPCCGTGSIAQAVLRNKKIRLDSASRAAQTTWASDKYSFPLQIARISLIDLDAADTPVEIFQRNAFSLTRSEADDDGQGAVPCRPCLPAFGAVVSNLPFVPFEILGEEDLAHIEAVRRRLRKDCGVELGRRSDLYAPLALSLEGLLEAGGRMGLITSNSWLGTDAGLAFWRGLNHYYTVEQLHISGAGRWFGNARVVAVLLVLEKKREPGPPGGDERLLFCRWNKPLEALDASPTDRETLINSALLGEALDRSVLELTLFRQEEVDCLLETGLSLNALFHDTGWLLELRNRLLPIREVFQVIRGERRGWDKLFYPQEGHGIEEEYLRRVLKSSQDLEFLRAQTDSDAFCCPLSKEELAQKGHTGALAWIERFEQAVNNTGVPLVRSLHRSGLHWYQMTNGSVADLVTSMNPDKRLFYARFDRPSFINQRLIGLKARAGYPDLELGHALLNSLLGMFFIEAVGFGRGLGALDINSRTLRNAYMWDPGKVSPESRREILEAFDALLRRPVLSTEEELARGDRAAFDAAVLRAFDAGEYQDRIRASLLSLQRVRLSARGNR